MVLDAIPPPILPMAFVLAGLTVRASYMGFFWQNGPLRLFRGNPLHPLLNKKMLALPGGEIISSTEHSKCLLTTFLISGIDLANDRSIFDSVSPDNHISPER